MQIAFRLSDIKGKCSALLFLSPAPHPHPQPPALFSFLLEKLPKVDDGIPTDSLQVCSPQEALETPHICHLKKLSEASTQELERQPSFPLKTDLHVPLSELLSFIAFSMLEGDHVNPDRRFPV